MYVQGSQNYNLETEASDIDCKAFVVPTFSDLYFGHRYSTTIDTKYGQVTVHDIRMLSELLFKMNPTYLEMLFSKYVWYASEDEKKDLLETIPALADSKSLFNTLFKYHKFRLIESLCGTFRKKHKETQKPSAIRQPVIDKYGYDIKAACHAVRCFRLLTLVISMDRYDAKRTPYDRFLSELRLEDERAREFLQNIKGGYLAKKDALELLDHEFEYVKWAAEEFEPYAKTETDGSLMREMKVSTYNYCRKHFCD
ncbi:MAG: nucleotidyltransferase domain-containing protein [Bacilli bacterium]|nr:nucleotidyltransferase domain-containing protein [Bacilli bacterium]